MINKNVIIFSLLMSQTSASFFGALRSVGSNVGRLLSDVGSDLRDTYDCTVHVIEKVIYDENEISEYYNKCKDKEPSENSSAPSETIITQKALSVYLKPVNPDDNEINTKLSNIEEVIKEQYNHVANISTSLDKELKSISDNIDQKLKKVEEEEEKELAIEKSLREFENKISRLEEYNKKDKTDEILKVFEEILRMLNNYTSRKDSDLSNEVKIIVTAVESDSSKTILGELKKWKEELMQELKDKGCLPRENISDSKDANDLPRNLKELVTKVSIEISTTRKPNDNRSSINPGSTSGTTKVRDERDDDSTKPTLLPAIPDYQSTVSASSLNKSESSNDSNITQSNILHATTLPVEYTTLSTPKIYPEQTLTLIDDARLTPKLINEHTTVVPAESLTLSNLKANNEQTTALPRESTTTSSFQENKEHKTVDSVETITISPLQIITEHTTTLPTGSATTWTSKIRNEQTVTLTQLSKLSIAKVDNEHIVQPIDSAISARKENTEQTTVQPAESMISNFKFINEPTTTAQPESITVSASQVHKEQTTVKPVESITTSPSQVIIEHRTTLPVESAITLMPKVTIEQTIPAELSTSINKVNNEQITVQTVEPTTTSVFKDDTEELSILPSETTTSTLKLINEQTIARPTETTTVSSFQVNNEQTIVKPVDSITISPQVLTEHLTKLSSESATILIPKGSNEQTAVQPSGSTVNTEQTTTLPAESTTFTSKLINEQTTVLLAESTILSTALNTEDATNLPAELTTTTSKSINEQTTVVPITFLTLSNFEATNEEITATPDESTTATSQFNKDQTSIGPAEYPGNVNNEPTTTVPIESTMIPSVNPTSFISEVHPEQVMDLAESMPISTSEEKTKRATILPVELTTTSVTKVNNEQITIRPPDIVTYYAFEENIKQAIPAQSMISTPKLINEKTTVVAAESLAIFNPKANNEYTTTLPADSTTLTTPQGNNELATDKPVESITSSSHLNIEHTSHLSKELTATSIPKKDKEEKTNVSTESVTISSPELNNEHNIKILPVKSVDSLLSTFKPNIIEHTIKKTVEPTPISSFKRDAKHTKNHADFTTPHLKRHINTISENIIEQTISSSTSKPSRRHTQENASEATTKKSYKGQTTENQIEPTYLLPYFNRQIGATELNSSENIPSIQKIEGEIKSANNMKTMTPLLDDYDDVLTLESQLATAEAKKIIDESMKSKSFMDSLFKNSNYDVTSLINSPDKINLNKR